MMKTSFHTLAFPLSAALLLLGAACTRQETPSVSPADGRTITVSAGLAQMVHTKADETIVMEGIYQLFYPKTDGVYGPAAVDFHKEGTEPGIGIITVSGDQALKWSNVGGGATPTFYLDNTDPALGEADPEEPMRILLPENGNPYDAGRFVEDENDLLWATSQENRGKGTLNFQLHHQLSRVRIQVTVNKENELPNYPLDLEGATVSISHLNQHPIAYDRRDGTLALSEDGDAWQTLVFVDKEGVGIDWTNPTPEPEADNDKIFVYTTQDFVLPPQGLLEDEKRPRLTIRLKSGKTYSGILPHAMEIAGEDPGSPSVPVALYFLKEHILTIRTVITEEPPELAFLPVRVVEWVDKGEFTIEGHQAGLYTEEEFRRMIKEYQDYNEYQLTRYGHLVTVDGEQIWHFNIFRGFTLTESAVRNTMIPGGDKKNFRFNLNNYTVLVTGDNGQSRSVNAEELYRIVSGK